VNNACIRGQLGSTKIGVTASSGQIGFPKYLLPDFEMQGSVEILLFNVDTVRKYGWQTVAAQYLIAKRYVLTYDSLKAANNVIKYP
jgi:hypothetical protein